ncbi:MAG: glycosyltransferase family 39 protein [Chloroflexota bacterium]
MKARHRLAWVVRGGWTSCIAAAGAALLLLAAGNLLLELFPTRFEIRGDGSAMSFAVDGRTHLVPLTGPPVAVSFPPAEPFRREYQIDGSDSTNNLNLDLAYFARIADSPYYRLQALLRDEDGYSRWRNLEIRDGGASPVVQQPWPDDGTEKALPSSFRLSVELHRLEMPRTVQFRDADGGAIRVEINRNDRYLRVIRLEVGAPPRELVESYFPEDWLPPAAEVAYLAMRTVAVALALIPLTALLALAVPFRLGRSLALPASLLPASTRPHRGEPGASRSRAGSCAPPHPGGRDASAPRVPPPLAGALPVLAATIALAAGCYTAVALFDRAPHILDAVSYYFQGKVLASGALVAPAPPVPEAFPTPFTVVSEGRWFSQYPPGAALMLAVGFLVGVPWLVEPLLAAAAALLVFGIGRRQYGFRTGALAAVLTASSPFLALQAGSFMSHVPAMFFIAGFLYAVTRYQGAPSRRWMLAAGLSLGGAFVTREGAALLYGLPVGLYVLLVALRRGRSTALVDLVPAGGGLAAVGVAYLLYNRVLTGSPLQLPRLLFFGGDRFGFGDGVGFYGRHTLAAGLVNLDQLLTSLSINLFGWPFYLSLAVIALLLLTGRTTAWDRLHGLVFALFVAAHVGYFYHGIALGPRYYFEALPSLALLTARGFVTLSGVTASLLDSLTGRDGRTRARAAVLVLVGLLLACNLLYFAPRQVELYRGFTGWPGSGAPTLGDYVQRGLAGRVPVVQNALITTEDWWVYSVYLAPLNSPRLDGMAVFALMPGGEAGERLKAAFAGRSWYRLVERSDRTLALEWQGFLGEAR